MWKVLVTPANSLRWRWVYWSLVDSNSAFRSDGPASAKNIAGWSLVNISSIRAYMTTRGVFLSL